MALTDLSDGDLRVVRGVLGLPMATAGDIAAVQGRAVSGVNRGWQLSDRRNWAPVGGVGVRRL